tara:strand:- start:1937 stop:2146 length:210 start_codon:yes stop_codon:yes gene_type:complete
MNFVSCFLLSCYLNGVPSGSSHFKSILTCSYFRDYLHKQSVNIGQPPKPKMYECFCKLVMADPKKVRIH